MATKPKVKMPIPDRAKQFMPFAALKGLPEALAAKEKIAVDKIDLSPEMYEELDRKMHLVARGMVLTVIYFKEDEYLKLTGMVGRIDPSSRILQIVNTKIPFDDILEVTPENLSFQQDNAFSNHAKSV